MGQPGVYLQDRDKAAIIKLRANGVSIGQIAKRQLVAESTVKRILRNNVDKKPAS